MRTILLHLILPMAFYTIISTILFLSMNLGALEATAASAVLVSPVIYYFYRKDQKGRGITPVNGKLKGCLTAVLLFGAALCILGNDIVIVLGLTEISKVYEETKSSLYSPPFFVQILASGILIPIVEELIFRGMVFASIREKLPFLPSAVLSAFLFGIYHGNLPQGVYAFLIGLAVAWLYEVCKTLLAPYLFHASANIFSICITNQVLSDSLFYSNDNRVKAAVAAVCIALSVICAIRIYSKNNLKEDIV